MSGGGDGGDGAPLSLQQTNDSSATIHQDDLGHVPLKKSISRIHNATKHETTTINRHEPTLLPPSPTHERQNGRRGSGSSLHIDLPHPPLAAETALAALQFLPTPLIVLSSLKTIVLANEAMGRLLGLYNNTDLSYDSITESLHGQTLSQIGIDMLSDGVPCWVSWEKFLDNLAAGSAEDIPITPSQLRRIQSGETTPTAEPDSPRFMSSERGRSPLRERVPIQDTAVDVVISSSRLQTPLNARSSHRQHKPKSPSIHATCRMIITIWNLDDQRFFTLTFTATGEHGPRSHRHHAHTQHSPREASTASTKSARSTQSHTPTSSTANSVVTSPSEASHHVSSMLPNGAPSKSCNTHQFTDFQKVTRMKDAMLTAMEIPVIAMWKDESVVFPNQAARKLLSVTTDPTSEDSYDFMSRFKPWTGDFSRELDEAENPIIKLCRTQRAFTRWQIGLKHRSGKQSNYDVSGYPVFDDKTGEFFAGLITFKDVTEYTEKIATQSAENEQQFQIICDTMPQMIWTTRPDGFHDYFSQRWYDYTGLKPEECRGLNWVLPFHPDDLAIAGKRWAHSLATGDEYLTEYRCMSKDGVWRWMLGRALPQRDSKTGAIIKWFGTCTDIQDIIDARDMSNRARKQLVDVLHHAQMTMWTIDTNRKVTFFEGKTEDSLAPEQMGSNLVGISATEAFRSQLDVAKFTAAMDKVFTGRSELEILELHDDTDRWFRLRLAPQRDKSGPNGEVDENTVIGIIGMSMEVTQMKKKEQENVKLLANESAAKEASKMKSSFLANMSHEIRTPIAGVLGMSELLMETELDAEQADFAQNIQRSANSLLTVINDILDFSKIESGRLDIEEVQFSLPTVLKDVAKMLSYAATRKNLEFTSDVQLGVAQEMPLLGDPGRIRQILTNLLTNSIKFTSDGYVKMSAKVIEDSAEKMLVEFVVQDTGIGIEEEVKKRLFRPFSQADSSTARRFGGTGLGLTISKNLVDLMHGEIRLDSSLDQGTTAVFRIPFKKPEFTSASHAQLVEIGALPDRLHSELSMSVEGPPNGLRGSPPSAMSPRSTTSIKASKGSTLADIDRSKIHILVVEDNPVNQQIALRFLKGLGFSVNAVWNGREALEYLLKATSTQLPAEEQSNFPVPRIILMDCQMPVLDGYHATHILRHHAPWTEIEAIRRTPIVAMTASAIQGDREKCERAGMDDYLAKPVKKPVLEKMIIKWISGSTKTGPMMEADSADKPILSRSGTDHSSNCAEIDNITHEILGSRVHTPDEPVVAVSKQPRPGPPSTRPSHAGGARRSSLTNNMLNRDMLTLESEADRGIRRAAQEEEAITLRDAKLIAATEPAVHDHHGPLNINHSPLMEVTDHPYGAHSPLVKPYPQENQEQGVMALTEENVERFNASVSPGLLNEPTAGDEDYFSQPLADRGVSPNESLPASMKQVMPISDIPGPPPDLASPGGVRVLTAKDVPVTSGEPSHLAPMKTKKSTHEPLRKSRLHESMSLRTIGRGLSNQSSSTATAKPENTTVEVVDNRKKPLKSPMVERKQR